MAINDQMDMAFGEQPDVDPVSGNEIPIGSTAEEVRDDIPAQLSEGEYVVPADVVRFFGVKFFEDIRAEAKQGFAAMEANGRIGGEPVGMEMGGDELPFDIAELQIVDDGTEEQPMMNKGGYISGYAPGGLVDTGDLPLTEENYQGTGMDQRQYSNSKGNIITILFFNGMPMSAVPDGYSPYTADAVPSEAVVSSGNDNDSTRSSMPDPDPIDYKGLSPTELSDLVKAQTDMKPDAIALGLGVLNPLMGMGVKAATWHQSKLITKELERRLEDGSLDAKQQAFYTDLTETMTADQPGLFERLFSKKEEEAVKKPEPVTTPLDLSSIEEALAYTPEGGLVPTTPTGYDPIEALSPITVSEITDTPSDNDNKPKLIDEDKLNAAAKEAFAFANTERSKRNRSLDKINEKIEKSKEPTITAEQVGGSQAAADAANSTASELEEQYGMLNKGGLMKKKKKKK